MLLIEMVPGHQQVVHKTKICPRTFYMRPPYISHMMTFVLFG